MAITKNTLPRTKVAFEPTLADQLTQQLGDQLRRGVYPVNSRLPTEKAMAEEFGISRTVVREVISRLKSEGLVETRQGSGTVVLDPSSSAAFRLHAHAEDPAEGVLRIIELRCGIEAQMAALAAERCTADEVLQIKHALSDIDRAVAAGGDGVKEDFAFHIAISRAAKNPYFGEMLEMLTRAIQDAIRVTRSNEAQRADFTDEVRAEHRTISEAIFAHDPSAARAAAFKHMENTIRRMKLADPSFWTEDKRSAASRLAHSDLQTVLENPRKTQK